MHRPLALIGRVAGIARRRRRRRGPRWRRPRRRGATAVLLARLGLLGRRRRIVRLGRCRDHRLGRFFLADVHAFRSLVACVKGDLQDRAFLPFLRQAHHQRTQVLLLVVLADRRQVRRVLVRHRDPLHSGQMVVPHALRRVVPQIREVVEQGVDVRGGDLPLLVLLDGLGRLVESLVLQVERRHVRRRTCGDGLQRQRLQPVIPRNQ